MQVCSNTAVGWLRPPLIPDLALDFVWSGRSLKNVVNLDCMQLHDCCKIDVFRSLLFC